MLRIGVAIALLIGMIAASSNSMANQTKLEPIDKEGTIAFLGLTLLDTSLDGAYNGQDEENRRILMLQEMIKDRFEQEGLKFADVESIQPDLERISNPAQCNFCDIKLARKVNANYSLFGEVHKVSNLILSMNLVLRDVETKQNIRARVVDIRSNTDESWQRGLNYILKNHFFLQN